MLTCDECGASEADTDITFPVPDTMNAALCDLCLEDLD